MDQNVVAPFQLFQALDNTSGLSTDEDGFLSSGQLYDVPIILLIFLCVAYGAVSLAAIIGNSSVLYFVVRKKRLRSVTNTFIANLATADILIGTFAIPFQFLSALLQRWILPSFMCPFCTFIQIVSVNVSIFTLTAIAADRYLIIANPIDKRVTKVMAKKIITFIWLIALLAASPAGIALQVDFVPDMMGEQLQEFFSNSTKNNLSLTFKPVCDNYGLDPSLWQWYNRFLILIQYILPVSFLIVTYGKIGLRLRNSGKRNCGKNEETGGLHEASSSTSQSQRRGTETRVVMKKGQSISESAENIAASKKKVCHSIRRSMNIIGIEFSFRCSCMNHKVTAVTFILRF